MIEIETIIPDELKRDFHQQIQSKLLWMKVLDLAYKDSLWRLEVDRWYKMRIWRRYLPALCWFYREEEGVGSLKWVCETLGLYETEKVRKKVLGLTICQARVYSDIFSLMEGR